MFTFIYVLIIVNFLFNNNSYLIIVNHNIMSSDSNKNISVGDSDHEFFEGNLLIIYIIFLLIIRQYSY